MVEVGGVNFNSLVSGTEAVQNVRAKQEKSHFNELVRQMQAEINSSAGQAKSNAAIENSLASGQIAEAGRLNGDFRSGFAGTFSADSDKNSAPRGAAAGSRDGRGIDRTSKLYEQAMEMESYFVKIMLSSMKNTVQKSELFKTDFAGEMYNDMLYDEYAVSMTKNAGFGLADQIYLQLSNHNIDA